MCFSAQHPARLNRHELFVAKRGLISNTVLVLFATFFGWIGTAAADTRLSEALELANARAAENDIIITEKDELYSAIRDLTSQLYGRKSPYTPVVVELKDRASRDSIFHINQCIESTSQNRITGFSIPATRRRFSHANSSQVDTWLAFETCLTPYLRASRDRLTEIKRQADDYLKE